MLNPRRTLAWLLLITLVLGGLFGPTASARQETGLRVVSDEALSDRLHEIVVDSPAMGGETTLRVLLPSGYDPAIDRDYPVLYLLHGCCDDYKSWSDKTDLEKHTVAMDLVVVMPDGGQGGWYTDWYSGAFNWESYHIGELIPWVESTYDVLPAREGRAVAGLSMGGFGAFSYAARHPDLFVAAAAFSGAVDSNYQEGAAVDAVAGFDGGRPGDVFGPRASEEVLWRGHNPWDLAENLDTVDLTMRTGNGESDTGYDPLERGVWEMMTNLHERLVELEQPHIWEDYGPGTHTWPYWERDLHKTLPRFLEFFANPRPAPSSFTHRNIGSRYNIFGWAVKLKRPVLEFSRLKVRGPGSFRLSGTGRALVTTGPIYVAGKRYRVKVGRNVGTIVADAGGHLRITVALGTPNSFQAFTPGAEQTSVARARNVTIRRL